MKVSIIIPVYNAERYIAKCIGSIIAQTEQDFEIIFINDRSTDRSVPTIYQSLEKTDIHFRIIQFPENKGVSTARNEGLRAAKGDYVQFIDADDWLEKDALEKMLLPFQVATTELTVCGVQEVYENSQPSLFKKTVQSGNASARDFALHILEGKEDGFIWRCLFKRAIIQKNNISFLPDLPIFEDTLFLMQYVQHIENVYFVQDLYYNYWCNDISSIHRFNPKLVQLPLLFEQLSQTIPMDNKPYRSAFSQLTVSYVTWILSVNAQKVSFQTVRPLLRAGKQILKNIDFGNIDPRKLGKIKYLQAILLKYNIFAFWLLSKKVN